MLTLASVAMAGGCARRAANEVYTDAMAAEIRQLEDDLYQYDHEFRVIEQEVIELQRENETLRKAVESASNGQTPAPSNRSFLPTGPNNSSTPKNTAPSGSPSDRSPTPMPAPSLDEPLPAVGSGLNITPKTGGNSVLEPGPMPVPGATDTAPPPAAGADKQPPTLPPARPSGAGSPENLPAPKRNPGATDYHGIDLNSLAPPAIDTGHPMPPPLTVLPTDMNDQAAASSRNQLELEVGRIEVPAALASAVTNPIVKSAVDMPRDNRIVEIKFHPALCRSTDMDSDGNDDGLYLVLQPCNEAGQFLTTSADLAISVLDPAREGAAAKIATAHYSAADVREKMQPIGSSQGIHLTIAWTGAKPSADQVVVLAQYTLNDGRYVANRR
ncbi:MAG: hypothetical protein U0892_23110 [Pirellulales bacterium]